MKEVAAIGKRVERVQCGWSAAKGSARWTGRMGARMGGGEGGEEEWGGKRDDVRDAAASAAAGRMVAGRAPVVRPKGDRFPSHWQDGVEPRCDSQGPERSCALVACTGRGLRSMCANVLAVGSMFWSSPNPPASPTIATIATVGSVCARNIELASTRCPRPAAGCRREVVGGEGRRSLGCISSVAEMRGFAKLTLGIPTGSWSFPASTLARWRRARLRVRGLHETQAPTLQEPFRLGPRPRASRSTTARHRPAGRHGLQASGAAPLAARASTETQVSRRQNRLLWHRCEVPPPRRLDLKHVSFEFESERTCSPLLLPSTTTSLGHKQ